MSLLFYKDNGTEEHIAGLNGQADLVSGKGVIVQNGEVSQTRDQLTFTGTRNEWDSLSLEQKAQYGIANITDDVASGVPIVVDAVTNGDMNPVTSNAVAQIVPSNASSTNKLATQADIPNIIPSTGISDCNSIFYGLVFCDNNVSHKPIADQSGTLLSFMKGTVQNPMGIQIFIPYNGYGTADFYFRDNSNAFSPWRKLLGEIM